MPDKVPNDVVDLKYLILAPISAVLEADYMAAKQGADFIEQYGFLPVAGKVGKVEELDETRKLGRLRMVSFKYDEIGADGLLHTRVMRIPALSLIPLPLLQVKRADFDFDIRILDAIPDSEPKPVNLNLKSGPEPPEPEKYRWRAMLANRKSRTRESQADLAPTLAANIKIKLEVGQADIPAGLSKLILIMGENAQQVSSGMLVTPAAQEISAREPGKAVVTALLDSRRRAKSEVTITEISPELTIMIAGAEWKKGEIRVADLNGEIALQVAPAPGAKPGNYSVTFAGAKPALEPATLYVRIVA